MVAWPSRLGIEALKLRWKSFSSDRPTAGTICTRPQRDCLTGANYCRCYTLEGASLRDAQQLGCISNANLRCPPGPIRWMAARGASCAPCSEGGSCKEV